MNAPMSMADVIVPKSDQINADDFIAGPQTITIREVKITGGQEQPVSIYFEGSEKAFRPCKSMSRVLVAIWGPDANKYVGRSLTLYRDPTVKWGGLEVGGIRISHLSDIPADKLSGDRAQLQLTATRGQRKPYIVRTLKDAPKRTESSGNDPARRWTDAYIATIGTLADEAAVAAFEKTKAAKLAELQTKRPELHQEVTFALAARREQISNSGFDDDDFEDDDLIPESPAAATAPGEASQQQEADAAAASEGSDDGEHGEVVTLESAKAELDAAETVIDVNNRAQALRVHLSDDEGDELVAYAGQRIDALKAAQ